MDDPLTSFGNAIREAKLDLKGDPIMDGTRQRIPVVGGKHGNKDGSYIGYSDGKPAGSIENFLAGTKQNWKYKSAQAELLTPKQKEAIAARQQQRADDLAAQHAAKALACEKRWNRATVMEGADTTPYLARKQVPAIGVRREGDNTLVPLRDVEGKLWSVQTIFPEKKELKPGDAPIDKVMAKDALKTGNFHLLGEIEAGKPVLVAEGYATGASARIASGHAVAIAFDTGNLDAVAGAIRARYPDSPMTILGDDDRHKASNAGREKATAAAEKHGAGVVFPQFAQEGPGTDFNDLHVTEGLAAVKKQIDNSTNIFRSVKMSKEIGGEATPPIQIPVLVSREDVAAQDAKVENAQEAVTAKKKPRAPKKPAAEKPVAAAHGMLTALEPAAPASASVKMEAVVKPEAQAIAAAQEPAPPLTAAERQAALANEEAQHKERINALLMGHKPMSDQEMFNHFRQLRAVETAAAQAAASAVPIVTPAQAVAAPVENSIEQGPARTVAPEPAQAPGIGVAARAAEAQHNANVQAAILSASSNDTDDGKRLHALIASNTELEQRTRGTMLRDEAGEYVRRDVAAIHAIKGTDTRTLALLVINDSQVAQMAYRQELGRQAPDVALASHTAYARQHKQDSGKTVTDFGARTPAQTNFADRSKAVPEAVKARFMQVDHDYFWPDKTPAFIDRDSKLATRGENAEVIRAMVQIAKARDWTSITVKGTEEFRRGAWLEASLVGMHVEGYKPTELDKQDLARRPSGNSVAHAAERVQAGTPVQSAAPVLSLVKPPETTVAAALAPAPVDPAAARDILVAHGAAKYLHDPDPKATDSYFVVLASPQGKDRTIWGVGLSDAIAKSGARIGDPITLIKNGQKQVEVEANVKSATGEVVGTEKISTIRNEWKIETNRTEAKTPVHDLNDLALQAKAADFLKEKPSFVVKKYEDLAPAYGTLDAAQKFADASFQKSEDRAKFVAVAKEVMAKMIAHGEKVPAPLLRTDFEKNGPELGKSQPNKSVEQQIEK